MARFAFEALEIELTEGQPDNSASKANEKNSRTMKKILAPTSPIAPPGWYPDPSGAPGQRYFDGTDWTEHRAAGQSKPKGRNKKLLIFIGAMAGLVVIGSAIGGVETNNKSTATTVSTSARAATPTTTTKSAVDLQREQAAVEAARAAETARMDPSTYETITPRDYAVLVKNPDAAKGRKLVVYGYVTQFDAATGTAAFRANTAVTQSSTWYDYDVNTLVMAPAGQSNILTNVVEGDLVTMYVEVIGAYSYDTQIGGNTTVPQFQVNIITANWHVG